MSFSDFAGNKKPTNTGAPRSGGFTTKTSIGVVPQNSHVAPSSTTTGAAAVIGEALLQYQRNVDILQNIVNSLNESKDLNNSIQQYEAQNHVLQQLEEKVKLLLIQQNKSNNTVVKLKRDFQRVQMRATHLQELATKKISFLQTNNQKNSNINKQTKYSTNNTFDNSNNNNEEVLAEQQRMIQQQIMEDRLAEQIMREREEEIRNINQGMHTVNEIYKDLAHIVNQQQEQIDTIETQMDDARANAESGLSQVEKANEKFGNTNCIIM